MGAGCALLMTAIGDAWVAVTAGALCGGGLACAYVYWLGLLTFMHRRRAMTAQGGQALVGGLAFSLLSLLPLEVARIAIVAGAAVSCVCACVAWSARKGRRVLCPYGDSRGTGGIPGTGGAGPNLSVDRAAGLVLRRRFLFIWCADTGRSFDDGISPHCASCDLGRSGRGGGLFDMDTHRGGSARELGAAGGVWRAGGIAAFGTL